MTSVLHVAQPVDGGVGRYVAEVAAAQRASGLQVGVASPPGWLADEVKRSGVPWVQWDAARSPGTSVVPELRRLRAVVRSVRPEVVHLHSSKAGLVGRLLLRGSRPTIFQPHGWAWQAGAGALDAASTAWERWAARWTTVLVCVSQDELDAGARHGVRSRRAQVVRNGVDLRRFPMTTPERRAAARRELSLPLEGPVTVCVGRLNEQKGQDVLVRAWPAVREQVRDARLALVGSGPAGPALEELAGRLGVSDSVTLVGEDMDVERWYALADVVAFSSRWGEAMPLTPMEAMASGCPVVASDVKGVREALGPGCGVVVAAGDAAAFATEIGRRLRDPGLRAAEGAAARRWAERHHDVRDVHAQLVELTSRLANP